MKFYIKKPHPCYFNVVLLIGSVALLMACAQVEYLPSKRIYHIDPVTELEEIPYYRLDKEKVDPKSLGSLQFDTKNGMTVAITKEKKPGSSSWYKMRAPLMSTPTSTTDFIFSVNRKQKVWIGIEKRYKVDFSNFSKWFK